MTADAASLWRTLMLPDAQFVMIAPPSAEALATAVSSSLVVLRRIAIINSISIATPFCSFSTPFSRLCKDAEPTSTCAVPWEKKHSKEAASQHTFSGHAFERKNMVAHKQNSHEAHSRRMHHPPRSHHFYVPFHVSRRHAPLILIRPLFEAYPSELAIDGRYPH